MRYGESPPPRFQPCPLIHHVDALVRFAGGHSDVGGGWDSLEDGKAASHIPLVYMIREGNRLVQWLLPSSLTPSAAQRAGLSFDPDKLVEMGCSAVLEDYRCSPNYGCSLQGDPDPYTHSADWESFSMNQQDDLTNKCENTSPSHQMLHKAHVARIHDSLKFASGLGKLEVMSWAIMEFSSYQPSRIVPPSSC